jgi:hypothetical protein
MDCFLRITPPFRGPACSVGLSPTWILSAASVCLCAACSGLGLEAVSKARWDRSDGEIEIRDRFWPYQRRLRPGISDDARRYVEEVKRVFLERRCVQSSFTIADEKMALSLYNRRVSLIDVQRAILLGAVRKYAAIVQNGHGTPISGLHYFTSLFEEVQQETSPQYWKYVAQKVKAFEQAWAGFNLQETKQ